MARKKNVFTPYIEACVEELATLNLLCLNARCVHKTDEKDLARQIRAASSQEIGPLRAAMLTGHDPFGSDRRIITFGACTASGKDLLHINQQSLLSLHGLVLCLAVETVREYLTAVAGVALSQCRKNRNGFIRDQGAFESINIFLRGKRGTATYCLKYAEWQGRKSMKEIFAILCRLTPKLRREMQTAKGIDASQRFLTVQCVRNSIIHQRGAVEGEWLRRLQKRERLFVESFLQRSPLHKEKRLLPNEEQVQAVVFQLCALSNVVYRALSVAHGMNVEYMPG